MNTPIKILEQFWGHTSFRNPQEEIINSVLEKKDTIALLPTGGGKSICFQIPSLVLDGICIVISPLLALIQDQVASLQEKGIKATTIVSGSNQDEIITLFDNLKFGNYKFLYLSPERLQSKFIQDKIKELPVNIIAIDEAHCISEWGHDFRPSYRNIEILKEIHPDATTICLTASATKKVLLDIEKNLTLEKPVIFKKSFNRENLAYQVFKVEDKLGRLLQILTKTKTSSIIYVNSRKKSEEISRYINSNNFKSTFYHGGLSSIQKKEAFTNWRNNDVNIIVSTNAFGMGIDKSDVGVVIHFDLPNSIENYLQEAGRAGRNGKKSFAVTLQNEHDILLLQNQTKNAIPTIKEIKEVFNKLFQHFQISLGEIIERPLEFNFLSFCKKYNFTTSKTATIITILRNNGIISITNNFNKKSVVKIIASNSEVLKITNKKNIINLLLRTYGGLFEQYVKIDEFYLAKKNNTSSSIIINQLQQLNDQGFLVYNKATNNSEITFLLPREDDKTINRISKEIEQFLLQKKQKTADFINFIRTDTICRSVQILHYFDEKNTLNCEICDVCLSNKKSTHKNISSQIIKLLKEKNNLSSSEICSHLHINEQEILIHLRTLLSEEEININQQNKYQIV
ncbi:ATP-dependent DNA helicase RecQ [Lutibacter sp. Hel_I_33_5]|uniref:RecQ family ATP-dependent DNA helicase n=1 Tax=Lutibacter sp. Hel_I_33_5 TaxID=1566289 RepID=UPI0011A1069B|nr:ATP-dependent DNA helicase RecQ [Lutibacter sp. Hel_I_33_5]TVZ57237.1 ATP-dependent DNA helicase RecQ [Lutibacter sp. Hel_I_33_5]